MMRKYRNAAFLGIGGIACLIAAWRALKGMLASPEQLMEMSASIGTKNPILARVLCWVGFIPLILGGVVLLVLAALLAFNDTGD